MKKIASIMLVVHSSTTSIAAVIDTDGVEHDLRGSMPGGVHARTSAWIELPESTPDLFLDSGSIVWPGSGKSALQHPALTGEAFRSKKIDHGKLYALLGYRYHEVTGWLFEEQLDGAELFLGTLPIETINSDLDILDWLNSPAAQGGAAEPKAPVVPVMASMQAIAQAARLPSHAKVRWLIDPRVNSWGGFLAIMLDSADVAVELVNLKDLLGADDFSNTPGSLYEPTPVAVVAERNSDGSVRSMEEVKEIAANLFSGWMDGTISPEVPR